MNNSMINPSVVDLLTKVEDRYSLVIVTSRRAREIIDGKPTLTNVKSKKPLTLAVNEVFEGTVTYHKTEEEEIN